MTETTKVDDQRPRAYIVVTDLDGSGVTFEGDTDALPVAAPALLGRIVEQYPTSHYPDDAVIGWLDPNFPDDIHLRDDDDIRDDPWPFDNFGPPDDGDRCDWCQGFGHPAGSPDQTCDVCGGTGRQDGGDQDG